MLYLTVAVSITFGVLPALVMVEAAVMEREKFSFVSPLTRPSIVKSGWVSGSPS